MKILIVEDDPDISDLLKRVLESDGYEVEMATDSAGALRAVAEGAPDLVLLDVVLGARTAVISWSSCGRRATSQRFS